VFVIFLIYHKGMNQETIEKEEKVENAQNISSAQFNPQLNRSLTRDIINYLLFVGGVIVISFCYFLLPDLLLLASLVGALLLAGFFLPRYVGHRTARLRAQYNKHTEMQKWGLASRDREGPWLSYISYPIVRSYPPCRDMCFCSEWLLIDHGRIIVNPGGSIVNKENKSVVYDLSRRRTYAWDGCSPKRWFFWIAIFGTPDWHKKEMTVQTLVECDAGKWKTMNKTVYWQLTDHASLIHDALYQYLDSIPLEKTQVDRLFYEMLKEAGMACCVRWLYYFAVKLFGASNLQRQPHCCEYRLKGVEFVD